ncbi:starch-binding domain-containing protein 1 isoform X2 [Monodelphis domestica]|uniref:Starch-binding domain-containing protein 1 n=1 Tax=Monodelphis domestica TaxID=13616 RepID=A0A5F8GYN8_MONDO|nr:starch-binding domain-containing protein 1 isoform X2 [Monodelphis domestica]
MGAVWSALLVGGGLAGALFIWLLRGDSGGQDAGPRELLPAERAPAARGGDGGGNSGDPLDPKPKQVAQLREQKGDWNVQKTAGEHHQESNGCLVSESKSSSLEGPTWKPQNSSTQNLNCLRPGEQVYSSQMLKMEFPNSMNHSEVLNSESLEPSLPTAVHSSGKFPSDNSFMDKPEEQVRALQVESSALADHEHWEMVPRHSLWRDADKGKTSEPSHSGVSILEPQKLDYGGDTLKDAKGQEVQLKTKRVAAVSQQVNVQFQVHYVTMSDASLVAVTGDHETLGGWHSYIPLQCGKDWFWSRSVPLPIDTTLKWKFVVVENGSIIRWEECCNRILETGHEDKIVYKWWGCH